MVKQATTAETSFLFDRKVESATAGLPKYYETVLKERTKKKNALTIAEYLLAMMTEINPADNYRANNIVTLTKLSRLSGHKRFIDMKKDDVIVFLDSYRKPEAVDPMHKWIGSYNLQVVHVGRFFRWLYFPDLTPKERAEQTPDVIKGIYQLTRKEQSIYKPTDLWTPEDDIIFLRYCPSKRLACYHAMSRDTSCRPAELLKLRIKDAVFKVAGGHQYAEALVNGKTGSRPIPLLNSLPYMKAWITEHPQAGNPNAPIFIGERRSAGRRITEGYLGSIYRELKKKFFPRLLDNPNVPPEDKEKIRELLKKPWNPYIRRHTALTEKAPKLKGGTLHQHAGWTPGSKMHMKYIHYFGNESNEALLSDFYGIVVNDAKAADRLKPRACPNCNEPNKVDARYCANKNCNMPLVIEALIETKKEAQKELENTIRRVLEERELERHGRKVATSD